MDDSQEITRATPRRPSSVPSGGRRDKDQRDLLSMSSSNFLEQYRQGTPSGGLSRQGTPTRPSSVGGTRREKLPRNLMNVSCSSHFLEQKLKLPGCLPMETFTQLGAWPARGATKPDNIDELLYNGVSQNREGRLAYLNARALIAPQKRYSFPATSAQEIAWEYQNGKASKCLYPVRNSAAACVCPS